MNGPLKRSPVSGTERLRAYLVILVVAAAAVLITRLLP